MCFFLFRCIGPPLQFDQRSDYTEAAQRDRGVVKQLSRPTINTTTILLVVNSGVTIGSSRSRESQRAPLLQSMYDCMYCMYVYQMYGVIFDRDRTITM